MLKVISNEAKHQEHLHDALQAHIPKAALGYVQTLMCTYQFEFVISKPRLSKFGDYRSGYKNAMQRITINCNLNQYAFLITLIHEIAHLVVHQQHKRKVKPHGKQWQSAFSALMKILLTTEVFPEVLLTELKRYLVSPSASSCTDQQLFKTLRTFDQVQNTKNTLAQLHDGAFFKLSNNWEMQRIAKVRTRIKCKNLQNQKTYLVSSHAEIEEIYIENQRHEKLEPELILPLKPLFENKLNRQLSLFGY